MDKERIVEELALDEEPPPTQERIAEVFNRHFAVIVAGARCVVIDKFPTACRGLAAPPYALIEHDQMKRIFAPQKVMIIREGSKPIVRTAFEIWWEHEAREEYMGGLVLDPALPPGGQPNRTWNIWPGLPFPETVKSSPRPNGSWRKLREHMLYNICGGNRSLYKFLRLCTRTGGVAGDSSPYLLLDKTFGEAMEQSADVPGAWQQKSLESSELTRNPKTAWRLNRQGDGGLSTATTTFRSPDDGQASSGGQRPGWGRPPRL